MSALPAYVELSDETQAKARQALIEALGIPIAPLEADAAIERVWNALVGHKNDPIEADG